MTREELIEIINDDIYPRSCPVHACNLPKENDSACRICAEKQLKEYEDKIRAEAIDEFIKSSVFARIKNPINNSECLLLMKDELEKFNSGKTKINPLKITQWGIGN